MLAQTALASPEQTLLLRAALLGGPDGLAAWNEWKRETGGIDRHDDDSYKVIPLLYHRLSAIAPDDPDLQRLKGIYRHTWYVNQRRFHALERVLNDFADASIPTLLLKGAALIRVYYGNAGVRPMSDVDVLVPTEQRETALQLLLGQGWSACERGGVDRFGLRHDIPLALGDQRVDLHCNAMPESVDDSPLWEASTSVAVSDTVHSRALAPSDQLVHLVLHGTAYGHSPVAWIADASTVIAAGGERLDWHRVAERASATATTLRMSAALEYLRTDFAANVPPHAFAGLAATRPGPSERFELRVQAHRSANLGWARYVRDWERWRRMRGDRRAVGLVGYLATARLMTRRRLVFHVIRASALLPIRRLRQSSSPSS